MAEARISPAHAVVIDAAIYLTAQVTPDDHTDMVWDLLADALPRATGASGQPRIDRIIAAAAAMASARKAVKAKAPDAGRAFFTAHWQVKNALTDYAWFRLSRSYDALKA